MSVVGPIAAKKLQGRECSEVFSLQQNSLVIRSSRPHRRTPAIRGTGCYGMSVVGAGHSGLMSANRITLPHFSVSSAMSLPKSAGEPASTAAAQVGKPRLHLGIGEAGIDLLVEPVDDFGGRVLGCADAGPAARLVARHKFAHGRGCPAAAPSASRWSPPVRAVCRL